MPSRFDRVVVVPGERLRGIGCRTRERVAAALGRHVDDEAIAHRRRRVHASELDVRVRNRLAAETCPVHVHVPVVGGHHAVHQRDVLPVLHALGVVVLAAAAIVVRPRQHAWRHLQEIGPKGAFGQRQGLLELGVDVHRGRRRRDFDHGRRARHGDRFLERTELQGHVLHLEVGARPQQNALEIENRKPRQFCSQGVGPGRKIGDPKFPARVGDPHPGRQRLGASGRDRDPGERAALLVSDRASQAAVSGLRRRLRDDGKSYTERPESLLSLSSLAPFTKRVFSLET